MIDIIMAMAIVATALLKNLFVVRFPNLTSISVSTLANLMLKTS